MTKPENPKDIKVDWESIDLAIEHEGEKIILPAVPGPMTPKDARKALQRWEEAQNTEYSIAESVECHFFDGLVAFARALKHKYGYSMAKPTPSFFGARPPRFVHVRCGPKVTDVVQVPFGSFSIPNIDGTLQTAFGKMRGGIPCLVIAGSVKAKEKNIVMELVALTKKFSKEQSIYKGQSIILEQDDRNGLDLDTPLQFFDPFKGHEIPIFNPETEELIDVAIKAPMLNSNACRKMKIPLKRGILLEGPYGTGKTLTAREVAKVANSNDWTFILVSDAKALQYALTFAKLYQPCVVFAEDIDRMVEERNEGANSLINEIDGVVGKNDEIITVLTTNFADKIDKAMLRPGRLDAVVAIRPPQEEAVKRLIRFYAGDLLDDKADISPAAVKLAGEIPATIREVVERAKLSMLHHGEDHITVERLTLAAEGMRNHLELISRASEGRRQVPAIDEQVSNIVRDRIDSQVKKLLDDFAEEHL